MRVIEDSETRRVELHREPLGVVLKPAPTTPLSTLRLGELVKDIVPPGVLNIIAGENDVGSAMTSHTAIRKISSIATPRPSRQDFSRPALLMQGRSAAP